MGESFRLHSQALVGYVDDIAASSNVSTPSMTSQGPMRIACISLMTLTISFVFSREGGGFLAHTSFASFDKQSGLVCFFRGVGGVLRWSVSD